MARAEGKLRFGLTDAGKVILRGIVFVALAALDHPGLRRACRSCLLSARGPGGGLRPAAPDPRHRQSARPGHRGPDGASDATRSRTSGGCRPTICRVRFHALPDAIEQTGRRPDGPAPGAGSDGRSRRHDPAETPRLLPNSRLPVCESSFPFNLFRFGVLRDGRRKPDRAAGVLLAADLSLPYVSRHVNASSLRPAGRVGTSPEYIGNRPFMPGDSPRRIDVRAWARLAAPATKEYDDDLDDYAAFVLDTARAGEARAKSEPPDESRRNWRPPSVSVPPWRTRSSRIA